MEQNAIYGSGELPIVGFPLYTIDRDLTLRSYKRPGGAYELVEHRNHHGGDEYNLWTTDKWGARVKKSYNPLRLYLCSLMKVHPDMYRLEHFMLDSNGEVCAPRLDGRPSDWCTIRTKKSAASERDYQVIRTQEQIINLGVLNEAATSGEWGGVYERLYAYRDLVLGFLSWKFKVGDKRSEELFHVAMDALVRKMKEGCYVYSNFHQALIKEATTAYARRA